MANPEPVVPAPSTAAPATIAPSLASFAASVPEPSATPEPSAIAASPEPPATAPPIAAGACRLHTQPGPDDAAPTKGDLTDWSHIFGGRMRLCLAGDPVIEVEGTAWCTWSDRFTTVAEVAMLPRSVGPDIGQIDSGVSLALGKTYLSRTAENGEIGSWEGDPAGQTIRVAAGGSSGIAAFSVAPLVDPEHPPAILPPNEVGLMRWSCLEAAPA